MKQKWMLIAGIILLLAILFVVYVGVKPTKTERIVVHGIENFNPTSEHKGEDYYLLFYPADVRVSQSFTLVKKVSTTGETLEEYEIRDDQFRRMRAHQKPNEMDRLYVSLFGEAVIENRYYTYDIKQQQFKKVDLTYFQYDVGVGHIQHYGPDVLFQNLVSHRTGEQNYDPETRQFNMSISNFTTQKSYETEYGYVPNSRPILQLGSTIIYSVSGQINDQGILENVSVGLINSQNESVEYTNFNNQATDFYPVYATKEHAYIIGDNGKLFILDEDLHYTTHEPFKDIPVQKFYKIDRAGTLLLNEKVALHTVSNDESGTTLGLLRFDEEPTFTVLDKDYIHKENEYYLLYQDTTKGEIYIKEYAQEKKGNILVLDNQSFDLIHKIPVDYVHLLDFVRKSN